MKLSAIRILVSGVLACGALSAAWAQEATGAGASFIYPLISKWSADYHKATSNKINYQSIGSGGGIAQIKAGTVDFGSSDKPLSSQELAQAGLAQFPSAIGGVVPVVNIPGLEAGKLRFLADWDAAFTKALGMDIDLSAGTLGVRSKRYSMLVEDGVVKTLNVEESPGQATVSGAAAMIEQL